MARLDPWIHAHFIPDHLRADAAPPIRVGATRDLLRGLNVDRELAILVARAAAFADRENRRAMTSIAGITPEALGVGAVDVAAFRDRNVRLITTLASEFLDDLVGTLEGASSDLHVGDLADLIQERFDVSESRARFWARDQTLKLNAQLTEARATASGIEEYVWTTSADERVRELHAALEGQTFRYDDPPVTNDAGDRNNPGEDYQCRCTAFPVLPEYSEAPEEIDQPDEETT